MGGDYRPTKSGSGSLEILVGCSRMAAALAGLLSIGGGCPDEASAQARWHLSRDPTVVFGSAEGRAHEAFHDVRGILTAADGMIVVADGGSAELRVFSASGQFVRSFGRLGDGPREFRRIEWIDRCGGDAIVAYDNFRHRITKWDTDGSLLDEFPLEGPGGEMPPYEARCGPSGKFVVVGWPEAAISPRALGPYRPNVPIGIADQRGRRERFIGEFPGEERLRMETGDRPHPFGKPTAVALGPRGAYVGTADSFAIHLVTPGGERRTFGRNQPIVPVTRELREEWVDAYLEWAPAERRPAFRRSLLDSESSEWLPTVVPAYAGLQIDRDGFIWVSPYVVGDPGLDVSVEWSVFDPDGDFVATVMMPARFRPMEIGTDYVLGVSTDAMDVERVQRYTLTR